MRYFRLILPVLSFLLLAGSNLFSANSAQTNSDAPRVFLMDGTYLRAAKQRIRDGDKSLAPAILELERDAKSALRAGPFSVVEKTNLPPSGDKHDYMSIGPYFWPDPTSSNGLPYIRHDGKRNPANRTSDRRALGSMIGTVETLTLAWYFRGDEAYAKKATELLRAWFIEPATRMNPNFEFAQAVPGVNTGRGTGLIEMAGMTSLVDSIGLLANSKSWTDADQRGVQQWFTQFVQWMQESKNGHDEAAAKNNHGTYYDVQVVSYALFVGRRDLAKQVLETAKLKRIAAQIEPDGRQPLELARTKAWSYSNGNLDGLMQLAILGERVGIDLWNFQTRDGRSIRKALDFLTPVALSEKKWDYQEIEGGVKPEMLFLLMRRAGAVYKDKDYQTMMARVPDPDPADRNRLIRAQATAGNQAQR